MTTSASLATSISTPAAVEVAVSAALATAQAEKQDALARLHAEHADWQAQQEARAAEAQEAAVEAALDNATRQHAIALADAVAKATAEAASSQSATAEQQAAQFEQWKRETLERLGGEAERARAAMEALADAERKRLTDEAAEALSNARRDFEGEMAAALAAASAAADGATGSEVDRLSQAIASERLKREEAEHQRDDARATAQAAKLQLQEETNRAEAKLLKLRAEALERLKNGQRITVQARDEGFAEATEAADARCDKGLCRAGRAAAADRLAAVAEAQMAADREKRQAVAEAVANARRALAGEIAQRAAEQRSTAALLEALASDRVLQDAQAEALHDEALRNAVRQVLLSGNISSSSSSSSSSSNRRNSAAAAAAAGGGGAGEDGDDKYGDDDYGMEEKEEGRTEATGSHGDDTTATLPGLVGDAAGAAGAAGAADAADAAQSARQFRQREEARASAVQDRAAAVRQERQQARAEAQLAVEAEKMRSDAALREQRERHKADLARSLSEALAEHTATWERRLAAAVAAESQRNSAVAVPAAVASAVQDERSKDAAKTAELHDQYQGRMREMLAARELAVEAAESKLLALEATHGAELRKLEEAAAQQQADAVERAVAEALRKAAEDAAAARERAVMGALRQRDGGGGGGGGQGAGNDAITGRLQAEKAKAMEAWQRREAGIGSLREAQRAAASQALGASSADPAGRATAESTATDVPAFFSPAAAAPALASAATQGGMAGSRTVLSTSGSGGGWASPVYGRGSPRTQSAAVAAGAAGAAGAAAAAAAAAGASSPTVIQGAVQIHQVVAISAASGADSKQESTSAMPQHAQRLEQKQPDKALASLLAKADDEMTQNLAWYRQRAEQSSSRAERLETQLHKALGHVEALERDVKLRDTALKASHMMLENSKKQSGPADDSDGNDGNEVMTPQHLALQAQATSSDGGVVVVPWKDWESSKQALRQKAALEVENERLQGLLVIQSRTTSQGLRIEIPGTTTSQTTVTSQQNQVRADENNAMQALV